MSRVLDAFRTVQARKREPWEPPRAVVDAIGRQLRARLGDEEPSAGAIKAAVDGCGWVTRMCGQHDIDQLDLMAIADSLALVITDTCRRVDVQGTGFDDGVAAGVGGGFLTGVYLGLVLNEGRGS